MTKIGVFGATGFVGKALVEQLSQTQSVLALTRTEPKGLPAGVEWRKADLFSATSTTHALKGVETAIYLVHSMIPSSHLFQGNFYDTDLLLADNFARACVANSVKQIIYLGGLMPEGYVSPHLQSRLEVETVFRATQIPVTVLRAGMIVGPGGSSFEILKTLVQRLPFMILPEWTRRSTQAVFIDDVVQVIGTAIENPEFENGTFDLVNGESLTYKMLLHRTADALKLKRKMIPVPIRSTEFSKLWVRIFGNSTKELVSPLIDSLVCDLPQMKPGAVIAPLIRYRTFEMMIQESLKRDGGKPSARPQRKTFFDHSVRSIQRLPAIPFKNSRWLAEEYMRWLPRFFPALIRVRNSVDQETVYFTFFIFPKPLLILKYIRGNFDDDRQKLHIVGGILSSTDNTGWLEFRQVSNKQYTLAAIHEFVPSLPWPIYVISQAPIHKFVMLSFGLHLINVVKSSKSSV